MIKRQIKVAAKKVSTWPMIGRMVRIGAAVVRLPETSRSQALELEELRRTISTEIQLLENYEYKSDLENLAISSPKIFRESKREVLALQQAMRDVTQNLSTLNERVEFVRRELMYEMRYGAGGTAHKESSVRIETQILNSLKLEEALGTELKINIGCGHLPKSGYINIDRRQLPGVDIVADLNSLPFHSGQVDEIYSAHLLEHFPQEELVRVIVPNFFRLLKPGGRLVAVVPDVEAMIRNYVAGSYPYEDLREVIYGAQDYDGDFHFNMFTPESIQQIFQEAGFVSFENRAAGRINGKCLELEIACHKPERE